MRRRADLLGCLGCLPRLILISTVVGAVVLVVQWLVAPWAFYLGGRFHPLPMWQGAAHLHSSSGDYVLYLSLTPASGGRGNYPGLSGSGFLCTPNGERYPMRAYATLRAPVPHDMNGMEMRIDVYRRPWYWSVSGAWDRRPRLTIHGRWQNPDFVGNDGGSLSAAFLPDGRLYDGPTQRQPHARETLPVALHEVPWTTWFPNCGDLPE